MKKLFLLLMAAAVFISALGFQVNRAQAGGYITYDDAEFIIGTGIVFTFRGEGFRNRDLRDATIWVGSDWYDLYCWAIREDGTIRCLAWGGLTQFAGQTGVIYLGGQIFYVIIPGKHGIPQDSGPISCPDGLVPGADVFVDYGEGSDTYFVPGITLDEVANQAESWFGNFEYEVVSGLYCGEEPT